MAFSLLILSLSAIQLQLVASSWNDTCQSNTDEQYICSYDEIISSQTKVLDGLRAQRQFIDDNLNRVS